MPKEDAAKMDVTIAAAGPKHAYSLLVLTKHYFPYVDFTLDTIQERLRDKNFHYFVAELSGHTIGFIDMEMVEGNTKILGFAVLPEFRNKGIGSMLFERALSFAKQKKSKKVFLLVAEDNVNAQKLYAKHGFVVKGKLDRKLGNKDILLAEKEL